MKKSVEDISWKWNVCVCNQSHDAHVGTYWWAWIRKISRVARSKDIFRSYSGPLGFVVAATKTCSRPASCPNIAGMTETRKGSEAEAILPEPRGP